MRRAALPFDIVVGAVMGLFGGILVWLWPGRRPESDDRSLVSIAPGTSIDVAKEKYGDRFAAIFYEDGMGGYFRRVLRYHYPMPRQRQTIRLREAGTGTEYEIADRRPPMGFLYATGMVLLILEVAWRAKRCGASVIRGRDPFLHGLMAWAASRISGAPFVISIHTDYEHLFRTDARHAPKIPGGLPSVYWLAGFVYRRAKAVLPIRESIGEWPKRMGVPAGRIRVIPHGVDLAPYRSGPQRSREELGLAAGGPLIVSVGRIAADNYFHHLPPIVRTVTESHPAAIFVAVGPGWDLERLREETDRMGLGGRLKWPGELPHDVVLDLWKRASIALVMKGGYSLIEAAASGRPVVSYDIEWHHELVRDGVTGRLVKPDAESAAAALSDLLSLPEDRLSEMGRQGRDLAFQRHSMESTLQEKRRIFDAVLSTDFP